MHISKSPTYEVVERLCVSPLDLDLVKKHLRIPFGQKSDDFYIQQIITAVVRFFESNTNTILLTTTFKLHLDCFTPEIEIRRKPNVVVTSVEYFLDGVLTVVDPLTFFQLFSNRYPCILPVEDEDWPTDADPRLQAVQVNFTAGYGATFDTVPPDLSLAIMQHITAMYENRGDCSDCGKELPGSVRSIYKSYTVYDISIGC